MLLALKSWLQEDAFLLLGVDPAYITFGDDQEPVLQEVVDAFDFSGGLLFNPQGRVPLQYLQVLFVLGGVVVVMFFSDGLHGLLLEIPVEELVVEEHARQVGYPGVIDPMGRAIEGLYPAVREHQGELRQVGPETEESLANPAA